jgi:acyl carrier protein
MRIDETKKHIERLVGEALAAKGLSVPQLTENTALLDGSLNIDSLDLAGIVVNLSEICQKDPFEGGFIEFRTLGELAALYAA